VLDSSGDNGGGSSGTDSVGKGSIRLGGSGA
jgi:hypothetical protein